MRCGVPSVEVRAAATIYGLALQAHERIDLYQQLREFEQTMRLHMDMDESWGQRNYG
jgi:hypothetical protein